MTDLEIVIKAADSSNNFQEFVIRLRHLSDKRNQKELQVDKDS